MEDNKHTQGEWHLNNPTDDNGSVIIKKNPQYGDQKYFAICIKNSFNLVGFYYPSSKQSESEMIANAKIICKAVNEYKKLVKEKETLIEALKPLTNLANEIFKVVPENKEGVLYGFNKAEITYADLRKAKELLNNLKK